MVFYQYLKQRGITDDRIILMLPENHACNPRNKYQAQQFVQLDHELNYYCDDIEIDYKSDDLTFDAILNLLRGRYNPDYPENKKLKTNKDSKIFLYFNGHGGDNFFKIQDTEVLQSEDLGKVYQEMYLKHMYKEVLMIMDTCHAMSLYDAVKAPNLFLVGSSNRDENAYSHQFDKDLSTNLNDKFSYFFHEFINGRMTKAKFTKDTKLSQFPEIFSFDLLDSNLEVKTTSLERKIQDLLLQEYLPLPEQNSNVDVIYYDLEDFQDIIY